MAKLNLETVDKLSTNYERSVEIINRECGMYLQACLSEQELQDLNEDWIRAGGYPEIPYWKYCLDNIEVKYRKR